MRIDKFLKLSRLIKRRTLASSACSAGRVMINGLKAKPGSRVKEGDVIEIAFGQQTVKAQVMALQDTVRKDQAENMYRLL